MHWYASYRTGGSTIMHIFKMHIIQEKEQAIAAAYGFLDRGYRDALKVGPPSGNREGRLLNKQNLQRVRSARLSRSGGID